MADPNTEHHMASEKSAMQLSTEAHYAEANFFRRHPFIWLFTLVAPFALTVAILVLLYYVRGGDFLRQLTYTAVITFLVLGKFAILFGRDTPVEGNLEFYEEVLHSLDRVEIFAMVLYMDLLVAALLVFHTGFLFKIPWIGSKMAALVDDGRFIMMWHPWVKRAMFVGLVAFVMFPLAATGSIGGSIFGRLLGMTRFRVFCGVFIGSILGCSLMYFLGNAIQPLLENPVVRYSGLAVIVLLVLWLNYRYRQVKKRRMAQQASESATLTSESPEAGA